MKIENIIWWQSWTRARWNHRGVAGGCRVKTIKPFLRFFLSCEYFCNVNFSSLGTFVNSPEEGCKFLKNSFVPTSQCKKAAKKRTKSLHTFQHYQFLWKLANPLRKVSKLYWKPTKLFIVRLFGNKFYLRRGRNSNRKKKTFTTCGNMRCLSRIERTFP